MADITSNQLGMTPSDIVRFIVDCRTLIAHSGTFYEVRDALSKAVAIIDSSGHETSGYPGDSVSRVLAEMTEAAQAARAHQRDSVYLFVEQWIGRLQILTGQQSSEKASTDRAVVEANALADAHRMYEAEHGHPFPQKP